STRFGFAVGKYDRSLPLTIDPGIAYSAFLGGTSFDIGLGIAVDAAGSAYVTGRTTSVDFPASVGVGYAAGGDAFVAKLAPGGSGNDRALALALDGAGNPHVTGETSSADFPVTPGAFDTTPNGDFDVFVTKLDQGLGVSYSTLLGGPEVDDGLAIAIGPNGNA